MRVPRSAAWAWGLAAALLLAQALGLAHRAWHAPGLHAAAATAAAQADFTGHAAGDADCRLVDALAAADALPGAGTAVPPALPAAPPRVARVIAGVEVRTCAPYLARAPPQG